MKPIQGDTYLLDGFSKWIFSKTEPRMKRFQFTFPSIFCTTTYWLTPFPGGHSLPLHTCFCYSWQVPKYWTKLVFHLNFESWKLTFRYLCWNFCKNYFISKFHQNPYLSLRDGLLQEFVTVIVTTNQHPNNHSLFLSPNATHCREKAIFLAYLNAPF